MSDVTRLLEAASAGDRKAAAELFPLVYDELRKLAAVKMTAEAPGHTLDATALVHEAYLRICRSETVKRKNRAHFYAVAAQQLRRVLLDHARRAQSDKRGGGIVKLSLWDEDGGGVSPDERLLAVDEALTRLEKLDPRAAKVVELRFFGGLTEADAAEALGISVATLKRDWEFAKTWLTARLA